MKFICCFCLVFCFIGIVVAEDFNKYHEEYLDRYAYEKIEESWMHLIEISTSRYFAAKKNERHPEQKYWITLSLILNMVLEEIQAENLDELYVVLFQMQKEQE